MTRKRVAVLVSGRGSNLSALIEAARDPGYPAEIALVVSNREDAPALVRASEAGIAAVALPSAGRAKADFEAALHTRLLQERIDIVCLAGFMRILSAEFVDRWRGRLINIHPSLLPAFPGLDTHERALAEGAGRHGCTVHQVRAAVDDGPIIAQAAVQVLPGDTAETLAARVLVEEHRLYPLALALLCRDMSAAAT